MIHGITENDVKKSLEFNEIYKEIFPFLQQSIVVAHNASFDMSVFRSVLSLYDISYPEFDYLCTYKVALKTWEGLQNYRLDTICNHFKYDFHHHNAKDDAIACGNILNWAIKEQKVSNPVELAKKIEMKLGCIFEGGYNPCSIHGVTVKRVKPTKLSLIVPQAGEFNEENELFQKKIVFTGALKSMSREEAAQKVVNIGGIVRTVISNETDFLVMGIQDYSRLADGKESTKTKRAKELNSQGKAIQIIDEGTFLEFLEGGGWHGTES